MKKYWFKHIDLAVRLEVLATNSKKARLPLYAVTNQAHLFRLVKESKPIWPLPEEHHGNTDWVNDPFLED